MGSYKFNATGTFPNPTEARYIDRDEKGISGDGHAIYAAPRKFEMKWEFMTMDDYKIVQDFYNLIQSTGTFAATIPQYGQVWNFYSYSGCTMREPQTSYFFETYVSNVILTIMGILT